MRFPGATHPAIFCEDYSIASNVARVMLAHSARCGAEINLVKSEGISLISEPTRAELKAKTSFVFLGHEISRGLIGPANKSVRRLKNRISQTIYKHLLLYPKRGQFSLKQWASSNPDWDLVRCVNEIRRYLYGRVSEARLHAALEGTRPPTLTKSALSHFPLVTDPTVFKSLDGWMLDVIYRAYVRRRQILAQLGLILPVVERTNMLTGDWYAGQLDNESALPSFMRAWRHVRRCYRHFGLKYFPEPPPYSS